VLGKGVSAFENNPKYHGVAPSEEELKQALIELGLYTEDDNSDAESCEEYDSEEEEIEFVCENCDKIFSNEDDKDSHSKKCNKNRRAEKQKKKKKNL